MTFQKIPGPYKRDPITNRVDHGLWYTPELEALQDVQSIWHVTEKMDGMNIRVIWDGYTIDIRGRTDAAILPQDLLDHINTVYTEEKFEQAFGPIPVIIYGEGIGPKIQGNPHERTAKTFVAFDVALGKRYLPRDDAHEIIDTKFGGEFVPVLNVPAHYTLLDIIDLQRLTPPGTREGLVVTTIPVLLNQYGARIICKIKERDFTP